VEFDISKNEFKQLKTNKIEIETTIKDLTANNIFKELDRKDNIDILAIKA